LAYFDDGSSKNMLFKSSQALAEDVLDPCSSMQCFHIFQELPKNLRYYFHLLLTPKLFEKTKALSSYVPILIIVKLHYNMQFLLFIFSIWQISKNKPKPYYFDLKNLDN